MKYLAYTIVIILALAVEAGVLTQFAFRGAVPDFIFLLVLYFATKHEDFDAFFVALAGGIIMDVYSSLPIGTYTLGYVIIGGIVHAIFHSVTIHEVTWKQIPFIVAVAVGALFGWIMLYTWALVHLHWAPEIFVAAEVKNKIIPALVYNLILLYPAMTLYTFFDEFLISLRKRRRGVI